MPLTPDRLPDAYRQMLVIRKFDETIRRLGAKHVPISVAEPLENVVLPQVKDIVHTVTAMF